MRRPHFELEDEFRKEKPSGFSRFQPPPSKNFSRHSHIGRCAGQTVLGEIKADSLLGRPPWTPVRCATCDALATTKGTNIAEKTCQQTDLRPSIGMAGGRQLLDIGHEYPAAPRGALTALFGDFPSQIPVGARMVRTLLGQAETSSVRGEPAPPGVDAELVPQIVGPYRCCCSARSRVWSAFPPLATIVYGDRTITTLPQHL
ncbi:hypothetical protein EGW08_017133 [Elysia chlorotica]|uniref:Uncharacterized protein n=1 Tax=Elysia chlorotica TaxID=188477 RepID=A0A433T0L9_ELYCH|nr:hypothetical protein EGW08_017133 [Elysia chlorotica]